jgi:hypothetical protein
MTEVNFKKYKNGGTFKRLGGKYDKSPVEFVAPYDGTWYAVIEKGSHFNPTNVTGSVEVLSPLIKEPNYFGDDSDWNNDSSAETENNKKVKAVNEVESVDSGAEQSDSEDEDDNEEKD